MNQFTAVVGRHNPHTGRQGRFDTVDLAFDSVDDVERVLAVTHYHDSTDDFALAVQLGYAASQRTAKMNSADVLHIDRCAVFHFEHHVLDVGDAFEITAAAHEIFRRRNFESF